MCDITLTIENEEKDLLMTLTPMEGKPKADLKKMQKAFKSSQYSTFLLIDGAMESLLAEVTNAAKDEEQEDNVCISSIIANAVDASVTLTIAPENMSATIELKAGYGGKHIENSDIVDALKEHKITKGIIKENLINIVNSGQVLQAGKTLSTEIAKGVLSTAGIDGYIKYLVDDPSERILAPKELDNGNVDMRELGDLVFVKAETKLAMLIKPTAGINGFNIVGKVIEAVPGKVCVIEEAEGSSFLDEKNNIIIAAIDGMPKHLDNSVSVSNLLEIEDIDVGTGNIRFDGSIFVKGNVREGMELYASEDIVIGGVVESAMISSGGNISIAQGVIGRQISIEDELENSVVLHANGDVIAQFVQYADIFAKNDIKVAQYISHSQIIVEGNLWVGNIDNEKADGKIFSTFVHTGGVVNVGTLGSAGGALTHINFNYWVDTVEELRIIADELANKLIRRLPKIYKLLASCNTQNTIDPSKIDRINKALKQHLVLLGSLNKNWLEKRDKISEHLVDLELSVNQSILSGVNIEISTKTCAFKRNHEATKIKWLENEINVEPVIN
ncbi:hypothetical protein CXF85_02365 [Colwellia sp. 75C3]|uniref:DUF342 domain-containing protein n=1 Tax=Colwellia sp. 75C3 TaxID=888425 RepID=UPI000C33CFE0|nr:FapA family protein [Colwellia sp. 75C3]PKG85657.1 hypothetical protein CXF85_02365 [Colwellia sp. 75C3]